MSAFFDTSIEHYFRKIDREYLKNHGLQAFTHSSSYYENWYEKASNSPNIVDICYIYINDYLNFCHLMPEFWKRKLKNLVMGRFHKTRRLILDKAKEKGLNFTYNDIVKIHELLNQVEITLDYNLLIWYTEQLKEILQPIRPIIIWR